MPDNVAETVLSVIAQYTEASPDQLSLDSSFEELAIDSLDGISVVADLEYIFNIVIPNDEAYRISTVREAVESLQKRLTSNVAQDQSLDESTP